MNPKTDDTTRKGHDHTYKALWHQNLVLPEHFSKRDESIDTKTETTHPSHIHTKPTYPTAISHSAANTVKNRTGKGHTFPFPALSFPSDLPIHQHEPRPSSPRPATSREPQKTLLHTHLLRRSPRSSATATAAGAVVADGGCTHTHTHTPGKVGEKCWRQATAVLVEGIVEYRIIG